MKLKHSLPTFIFFYLVLLSHASSACVRDDFLMGATTFLFTSKGNLTFLEANGFNWLRILPPLSVLSEDSDGDGKKDIVNWLDRSKQNGWNMNYDLVFYEVGDHSNNTHALYEFLREITENITEKHEIGIYEIGRKLDLEGFAGLKPETKNFPPENYSTNSTVQSYWQEFWYNQSILLKSAVSGVKSVDRDAKILLHLTHSSLPDFVDGFVSKMITEGVDFDYVGFTNPGNYEFTCDLSVFEEVVERVGKNGKKVLVVEWIYPNSPDAVHTLECLYGWNLSPEEDYSYSEEGQAACIEYQLERFYENPIVAGVVYAGPLDENFNENLCMEKCGRTDCNRPLVLKKSALEKIREFMCREDNPCCHYCSDVDLNEDGKINIVDIFQIAVRFGVCDPEIVENCDPSEECLAHEGVEYCYAKGFDVNRDGRINIVDVSQVARRFGKLCLERSEIEELSTITTMTSIPPRVETERVLLTIPREPLFIVAVVLIFVLLVVGLAKVWV